MRLMVTKWYKIIRNKIQTFASDYRLMHMKRGKKVPLRTLVPNPDLSSNKYYVARLKEVVRTKGVNNIALSGDYGTGKSSIIGSFRRNLFARARRIKIVSLLTLSDAISELDEQGVVDGSQVKFENGEDIRKNIQREIFRQLFYSAKPGALRLSRYPRIGKFPVLLYGILTVSSVIALYSIILRFGLNEQRNCFLGFAVCLAIACLIYAIVVRIEKAIQNISVKGIGAGGFSFDLANEEPDFEHAVDEFIYFFRRTGCRIVVLEDLDRFSDSRIYEELRQLNTVINGAKHIHRKVVFVYALRDSLIVDPEKRTKLFDAIVPVIPFMTQDNVINKISSVFDNAGFGGEDVVGVCKVLARHTKDMRTVQAVCNTAIIMRDTIGGTNDDLRPAEIIAMAMVRELFPEEYEKIRKNEGELDSLYEQCSEKKSDSLRRQRKASRDRAMLPDDLLSSARSDFWKFVTQPLESDKRFAFVSARMGEGDFTLDSINAEFWENFVAGRVVELDIQYKSDGYYPNTKQQSKIITFEMATGVSGSVNELLELLSHDVGYYELLLESETQRDVFAYADSIEGTRTGILSELIAIGAIDGSYKLYLSPLADVAGSAELRAFRVKVFNNRSVDYFFTLSSQDVQTILDEADVISLRSPSFYNHYIIKWLVLRDDNRLEIVLGKDEKAPQQLFDFFDAECCLNEQILSERYARGFYGNERVVKTLPDYIDDDYILGLTRKMAQAHPIELLRLLSKSTKLRDTIGKEVIFTVTVLSLLAPEEIKLLDDCKAAIGSFLDYYEDTIIANGGADILAKLRIANGLSTKHLELYHADQEAEKNLISNMQFEINDSSMAMIPDDIMIQKMEKDGITKNVLMTLVKNKVAKVVLEYCLGRPDIYNSLVDPIVNELLIQLICQYNIKLQREQIDKLINIVKDESIIDLLLVSDLTWEDYASILAKMHTPYSNIALNKRPLLNDNERNRKLVDRLRGFDVISSGPIVYNDKQIRIIMKRTFDEARETEQLE